MDRRYVATKFVEQLLHRVSGKPSRRVETWDSISNNLVGGDRGIGKDEMLRFTIHPNNDEWVLRATRDDGGHISLGALVGEDEAVMVCDSLNAIVEPGEGGEKQEKLADDWHRFVNSGWLPTEDVNY